MVRRYEEPIEVSTQVRGPATGWDIDPRAFVWRGRHYAVRAIQERWAERRSWWLDRSGRCDAPDGPGSERKIWRVEAASGRTRAGVFDIGLDGRDGRGPWLLLRAQD